MEKGRALPDWYLDGPDVLPGEEFYLKAFHRLSTCRLIGMSHGPIPWRDIVAYADRAGLNDRESDVLVEVIQTMDAAWLDYHKPKDPS